jgi:hypothetical protein
VQIYSRIINYLLDVVEALFCPQNVTCFRNLVIQISVTTLFLISAYDFKPTHFYKRHNTVIFDNMFLDLIERFFVMVFRYITYCYYNEHINIIIFIIIIVCYVSKNHHEEPLVQKHVVKYYIVHFNAKNASKIVVSRTNLNKHEILIFN